MAFMVDLAQVAGQRLRKGIPEFWKSTAQFDKLRRAEWVYSPEWRSSHVNTRQPQTLEMEIDAAELDAEPIFDAEANSDFPPEA